MTISSEIFRNDYLGNNTTATFTYNFKIFSGSDLKVTKRDISNNEVPLTLATDYTVTGVGEMAGGTIVLVTGNLPTGYRLTIRRNRAILQSTDIRNQGPFYPEVHEDAFDHHTMIDQQQQSEINRAIKLPETVTGVDVSLPVPEAGKVLMWDDAGTGLTQKTPATLGSSITTIGGGLELISGDLRLATMVDASKYSSIKAACDAIGTVNLRTLIVYAPINTSNAAEAVTISSNISVLPCAPGVINKGSATSLTINGPVVGGPMHQWLSGFAAGEILFTARGLPFKIHPIWFGMKGDFVTTGTVNNVAWGILMGALISDSAAFPVIEFEPQGLYKWTNTMLINKTCTIYWNRAVLKCEDDAGQSNTAVRLEAADIHIYDGPLVSSGSLSTNQSTNGIGLYLINADGARIYGPNISEFTSGIRIVGSSDAIIDVAIYNPIIANCTTLFSCDASGAGSSFNNINVFGGYIHNPNLVAYNITNARNVQLDGSSASATCDGVNFYGTVIEASNINSGTKCELIDVHNCSFNNIYWDNTSVITAGKDIHVLLSCSNISFIGGANLGNQKITNGCTSLIVVDPTKGIVCSGGRRLADSSGATDEHTGYMQKWILQDDNLGDDVTKNLPDATNGILLIHAGVEGGVLLVKSDGTITIVSGTANLVNTDTDTKLCVYTNATRAIIKNRLGSSIIIRAEYTYL